MTETASATVATSPRWGPRFSLGTLLLLVALFVVGLSHWQSSQLINEQQDELRELRRQTGTVRVTDRSKIHLLTSADFGQDGVYRWHAYFPRDEEYTIHVGRAKLPEQGLPGTGERVTPLMQCQVLGNGYGTISVQIENSRAGLSLGLKAANAGNSIGAARWLSWYPMGYVSRALGNGDQWTETPGVPIVLLTLRKGKSLSGNRITHDPDPTDGIYVWIEPK